MKFNSMVPLIFVETGRRPSRYLINNLSITKSRFPEQEIILILSKRYISYIKIQGIELVAEEDLSPNVSSIEFESIAKQWKRSQLDFWINTTKRFFILGKYMEEKKIEQLIHLESDCILLNINGIKFLFDTPNWGIKFPKQHHGLGCASILIVNKRESLNSFLKFVISNWHLDEITDMDLLGAFVDNGEEASYLPSGDLLELANTQVFDAVSIGHYFLGADARNQRYPFSNRGGRDLNPGSLSMREPKLKLNTSGCIVYSDSKLPQLELANVHVHSKRIPKNYATLEKMLLRDSRREKNCIWKIGAFDYLVFLERLVSYVNRRIFGKKGFELRFR